MRLVAADDGDVRSRVERLLSESGLPAGDLETSPVRLYAAYEGGNDGEARLVGCGGVEAYGPDALLRSVAVPTALRGRGYGTAIYRELESRARKAEIQRLYLLTDTAAGFFADNGFERIDREDAPESIRETTEFRDLCSSEATCMRKVLE